MYFEYDSEKSESNAEKHGIDFEEAQALWDDPYLLKFDIDYGGEKRYGVIARLFGALWTAIYTIRGENTRIISVRRSASKEVSLYDRKRNDQ